MRTKHISSILLLFFAITSGCEINNRTNDRAIAQVGYVILYESEIRKELPSGMNPADSSIFAQDYITNWIKQQLLLAEVQKELSPEDKDVSREIERYRQGLLIHKYKEAKIGKIAESDIAYEEIETFYNENRDKYMLDRIIVRVSYSILPEDVNVPDEIKRLLVSNDVDDLGEAEDFMVKYAHRYDNFDDNWIYFDDLLNSVNYQVSNETDFLRRNKIIEFNDKKEHHIVAIKEYMVPGEFAPLDFVMPKIRLMMVNRRKLYFLREIKDSLYNEAMKYNKFRLFN